jgi:hypothetical protein
MITPKIKHWNWFVKIITFNWPTAITLAPVGVFIKDAYMNVYYIINEEKIHWSQEWKLLIIPYYLIYVLEWLVKLPFYRSKAYMNLSMEREANAHCWDETYWLRRKTFDWIKYL